MSQALKLTVSLLDGFIKLGVQVSIQLKLGRKVDVVSGLS